MTKVVLRREGEQADGERILFPKGKYRVKLMGQEQVSGKSKVKKNGRETGQEREWSGLSVELKFVGGEYAGHSQDFVLFDGREAQLSLFEAAGFEIPEGAMEVDLPLDDLVGLDLNVYLDVNKAGTYNNIVRFEPAPRPVRAKAAPKPELEDDAEVEEEVSL
jgi:hypothetical protein